MKKNLILSLALVTTQTVIAQRPHHEQFSSLTEASAFTRAYNDSIAKVVESFGREDFENANRGFIARYDDKTNPVINNRKLISLDAWQFLDKEAPATVNPALWRQSQLNSIHDYSKSYPEKFGRYVAMTLLMSHL